MSVFGFGQTKTAPDSKTKVEINELLKTTKSWDGSDLPNYAKGQFEIKILKAIIQPKVKVDWHKLHC